jgi:hypothetical protein
VNKNVYEHLGTIWTLSEEESEETKQIERAPIFKKNL